MKSLFVGIKSVILWSYERGTWQYDVLCLLIISTVFLVPGKYFGDRDRVNVITVQSGNPAGDVRTISSLPGETVQEIAVSELKVFLDEQHKPELMLNPQEGLSLYLRAKLKQDVTVVKFEPLMNPTKGVAGYKVWTR